MTDLRKAAEMALEALEIATTYLPVKTATLNEVEKAIQALRQALAQPKREWVGLTDRERNSLWRDVTGWGDPSHDDEDLMKAIEAKLKEKNGG